MLKKLLPKPNNPMKATFQLMLKPTLLTPKLPVKRKNLPEISENKSRMHLKESDIVQKIMYNSPLQIANYVVVATVTLVGNLNSNL
jgi:hypothetical protein